jgi:hypothetical protein
LRGILTAKEERIESLKIVGEFVVIIKSIIDKVIPMDNKLVTIIARDKKETCSIENLLLPCQKAIHVSYTFILSILWTRR